MNDMPVKPNAPAADQPLDSVSSRRRFLRTSGKVAVAAPAAVLLLAASNKSAMAQTYGPVPT